MPVSFVYPLQGGVITSVMGDPRPYGRHEGVDIAPRGDKTVYAIAPGQVVRIGYDPQGYGRFVIVRHPNGFQSLYGHLDRVAVRPGQLVQGGQTPLGIAGATGMATGVHVHLSVKNPRGQYVDPLQLLTKQPGQTVGVSPHLSARLPTGLPGGDAPFGQTAPKKKGTNPLDWASSALNLMSGSFLLLPGLLIKQSPKTAQLAVDAAANVASSVAPDAVKQAADFLLNTLKTVGQQAFEWWAYDIGAVWLGCIFLVIGLTRITGTEKTVVEKGKEAGKVAGQLAVAAVLKSPPPKAAKSAAKSAAKASTRRK